MSPRTAARVGRIDMSPMGKMLDHGQGAEHDLTLGEPDLPPPPGLLEALRRTGEDRTHHGYSPSAGLPMLREALAAYESQRQGLTVEPAQVMVTLGATEALAISLLGLAERGSRVLIPELGFVLNEGLVRLAGATPMRYPLDPERGHLPDMDSVAELITPDTSLLLVNSPSNPTGACWPKATVRGMTELAVDHDLALVSDEVYDRIHFTTHHSFLPEGGEGLVYLNSFSKLFAIPGWRLGWMVAAPSLVESLFKLHFHLASCPPTLLQRAVTATLRDFPADWLQASVRDYRRRRDLMVDRLNDLPGLSCTPPGGGFFAFTRCQTGLSSGEMVARLARAGVLCTPGTAFGPAGEGYLRFSFAAPVPTIEKGLDLVEQVLGEL